MRTGILVLALAALAGGTARAQKVLQKGNTRAGFWIGFGVGAGSAGTDCSSCSTERFAGLSGYLRLGGTVSQHILIGGETNGWVHSQRGADENMGFLSAVLVWYPSRTGAFFLKFGLGALKYTGTSLGLKIEATAPSASVGLGYDIHVGRNFSVTPFLNSLATSAASFTVNGVAASSSEDIKLSLVQFGVGVTWH
jgi:hypothetical protein